MERWTLSIRKHWLESVVHLAGVLLLMWTVYLVMQTVYVPQPKGALYVISKGGQRVILFSGKVALILLLCSLACTPLSRILRWRSAIWVRKALGLWGFGFALFHAFFFMGGKALFYTPDAWLNLPLWFPNIYFPDHLKTPYAAYGAIALTLLLPLALTSNRWAMRWLGKWWKRLHRLVYLAVPLAFFHYWRREMSLALEQNGEARDDGQLLLFVLLLLLLLLARIPVVRRRLMRFRCRGTSVK